MRIVVWRKKEKKSHRYSRAFFLKRKTRRLKTGLWTGHFEQMLRSHRALWDSQQNFSWICSRAEVKIFAVNTLWYSSQIYCFSNWLPECPKIEKKTYFHRLNCKFLTIECFIDNEVPFSSGIVRNILVEFWCFWALYPILWGDWWSAFSFAGFSQSSKSSKWCWPARFQLTVS